MYENPRKKTFQQAANTLNDQNSGNDAYCYVAADF
jgi:hypothetical protein